MLCRGALVLQKGNLMWPAPPPPVVPGSTAPPSGAPAATKEVRPAPGRPTATGRVPAVPWRKRQAACTLGVTRAACVCVVPLWRAQAAPVDLYPGTLQSALVASAAMGSILAVGLASPSAAFSSMLTKFGLASICGEPPAPLPSQHSHPHHRPGRCVVVW